MVRLAVFQRKCSALTMLSPGMQRRPPPSGRVSASGSEAKFGQPRFGPSNASRGGGQLGTLLRLCFFHKREETESEKEEREGVRCFFLVLFCLCALTN